MGLTLRVFAVIATLELITCHKSIHESQNEYLKRRNGLLEDELTRRTGSHISLTAAENTTNGLLMFAKTEEIENARTGNSAFLPALHFFNAKPLIDKSIVFKILKTMPKGAVLHVHDSAMVDVRWLIQNATYLDHCYMCYLKGQQLQFYFFPTPPHRTKDCKWESVRYLRSVSPSVAQFDQWLYTNMTLVVDNPAQAYPTQTAVWKRFASIFKTVSGLVFYAPVFKAYYRRALQMFYGDNVLYVEVRALLPEVYELDGSVHRKRWLVKTYQQISHDFQQQHPDFMGSKLIFTSSRAANQSVVGNAVLEVLALRAEFPDFVAGYDLVGQEDPGNPLLYFTQQLLKPSQMVPPVKLPYFFHAGETDWNLEDVDDNLLDAILLNTSRIGHGYALSKHPEVLKVVKQRGIAVELNPISNQVLGLVSDLRNHPAAVLLATAVPVVVSCDDPSMWGATGVTYDWYELFMGIAGAKDNLKLLKQLAIDSIRYSAMSDNEKSKAMVIWEEKWTEFIHRVAKSFGNHVKHI